MKDINKAIRVEIAENCTTLASLTSYSWSTITDLDDDTHVLVHRTFNDALDYLHKTDDFCYGLLQTDSLRQIIPELEELLVKREGMLEKGDAILLG